MPKNLSIFTSSWSHLLTWLYLRGWLFMHPTLKNQLRWYRGLSGKELDQSASVWQLLVGSQLPLLFKHGSRAHANGIKILGLNCSDQPQLQGLSTILFSSSGWSLTPVEGELEPRRFFSFLERRVLPIVERLRPMHEIWCASRPDFWHEAVGHASCLTDTYCAQFYQWCGQRVTRLYLTDERRAVQLTQLLWVVLEYGFIQEDATFKSFGAALTGSFMGLHRFDRGHIGLKLFCITEVLHSRLFDEDARLPRSKTGRIKLFYAPTLDFYKTAIDEWLMTTGA